MARMVPEFIKNTRWYLKGDRYEVYRSFDFVLTASSLLLRMDAKEQRLADKRRNQNLNKAKLQKKAKTKLPPTPNINITTITHQTGHIIIIDWQVVSGPYLF